MNIKRNLKVIVLIMAMVVLLAGGIGITGAAAQSAIPGDALYGVKTTIESTRLSLAQDAGDRAEMKLAFAEQRLTEIGLLISDGRYREIREAVLAFENNINAVMLELETVAKADPQRAVDLTREVTSALTRYAQTLSELAVIAPESVRPEVTRALDTTHLVTGMGQSTGNENASANDNGDDNSNSNNNDNGDDDTNNANGNDNGYDDNSNMNGDDNGDDDNTNSNNNDNGDEDNSNMNGNNNDDDNSSSNANTYANDDVDDNSNDNGDDNANGDDNSSSDDNGSADSGGGGNSNDNGGYDDDSGSDD